MLKKNLMTLAATLSLAGFMSTAQAAEVTLSAVSAFAEGTAFSKNFEIFVKRVNETGKGKVQIDYKGGGRKVMSPFEVGNAVRTGVVQVANAASAFYTKLLPEGDAIKLSAYTITEERKNGAWAFMNELHQKKMNAYHLGRQKDCVPFHLYLTKPVTKPDLKGFKIRVTPIYRAFFADMGASLVRTAPGDVYTALERKTVDGYGWPIQGIFDLGWHEVTKYRVDPGFYRSSVEFLVNLDAWKKLDAAQKKVLQDAMAEIEAKCGDERELNAKEAARQVKDGGITVISFDRKAYLKRAYDTGWAEFVKNNPENGPKLKKLLSR